MIIIAWIVLIFNLFSFAVNFFGVFTEKTTGDRVLSFIGCVVTILTCTLSICILRI